MKILICGHSIGFIQAIVDRIEYELKEDAEIVINAKELVEKIPEEPAMIILTSLIPHGKLNLGKEKNAGTVYAINAINKKGVAHATILYDTDFFDIDTKLFSVAIDASDKNSYEELFRKIKGFYKQ